MVMQLQMEEYPSISIGYNGDATPNGQTDSHFKSNPVSLPPYFMVEV